MLIDVSTAVQKLLDQEVVAMPTETVYGLAGLATSEVAVERIYAAKNRPADNPLICHFYGLWQIQEWVAWSSVPNYFPKLFPNLSPGPVSYLLPLPADSQLKVATRGLPEAICRVPQHSVAVEILQQTGWPLAAPSANSSGKFSPTTAHMVEEDLGSKIAGVVDGGKSSRGLESTIIDCRRMDAVKILRPGVIGKLELEEILIQEGMPQVQVIDYQSQIQTKTPGHKYRHYSPVTPVQKIEDLTQVNSSSAAIFLTYVEYQIYHAQLPRDLQVILLGDSLSEVAANFYQKLWELDNLGVEKGYWLTKDLGSSSLAKALENRLEKVVEG